MSYRTLALASAIVALPAVAVAQPLNAGSMFMDAAAVQKIIICTLAVAMVAAIAVTVGKLRSGQSLAGGSAFVSGLRLGGPIMGGLGASYAVMVMAIYTANNGLAPTLKDLAPGIAEAMFMLVLGCLAGTVGVILNWAIESRIDRQVLAV